MNDLESYFYANPGRATLKWLHYFEIYDRHFARFRGTDVTIMEIGVGHGGSLQMWRQYFGKRCQVIGVDTNERCKAFEEPGIQIEIGNQADRDFLRLLMAKYPGLDIIVDDGGHQMVEQITSFEELFWHLSENGVYLCEDLHTSYWLEFGGGLRRAGTFIEFSKGLIDALNAWHSRNPRAFLVGEFTRTAWSMHYYDSVFVVEKRSRTTPRQLATGTEAF
jgi:SAM-dependent methyltransferase